MLVSNFSCAASGIKSFSYRNSFFFVFYSSFTESKLYRIVAYPLLTFRLSLRMFAFLVKNPCTIAWSLLSKLCFGSTVQWLLTCVCEEGCKKPVREPLPNGIETSTPFQLHHTAVALLRKAIIHQSGVTCLNHDCAWTNSSSIAACSWFTKSVPVGPHGVTAG